jgi:uncharacterized Tic20 family protein
MKILNKINVSRIFLEHIKTLRNDNSNKPGADDILTFLLVPFFFSACLMYFNIRLNGSATEILITTLSILVGLLFNVIVIIFDIIKRDNSKKLKNRILEQLLANISYTILISIVIIIITLSTFIRSDIVCLITHFLLYFLLSHYFLTVLMILKRMYALFINELKEIEDDK